DHRTGLMLSREARRRAVEKAARPTRDQTARLLSRSRRLLDQTANQDAGRGVVVAEEAGGLRVGGVDDPNRDLPVALGSGTVVATHARIAFEIRESPSAEGHLLN